MQEGQLCAIGGGGPALYWKDETTQFRLNDEPKLIAYLNGSKVTAFRCSSCRKIILDYKEKD